MLERRRPLPVGRYWADVFPQNRPAWSAWIDMQTKSGNARIESTSHDEGSGGAPEHDWVLWTTSVETIWPDDVMGFAPNVAGAEVTQSSDTVQRPDPEKPTSDKIGETLKDIVMGGALFIGGAILAGFALSAFLKHNSK